QELAGPGTDVARLAQDRLRGGDQLRVLLGGQVRRGRLLDQLLVAALQGAVAGGVHLGVAVHISPTLGLPMARGIEVTRDEALPTTEGGDGLTHRGVEQLAHLALLARHLQAATSAPESRLDGDRQPVLTREVDDLVGGRDRSLVPATSGAPAFWAMWRAETLSPSFAIASGGGPIQVRPASITARAKSAFSDRKP